MSFLSGIIGGAVGGIGSLLGGYMQKRASDKATNAQSAAAAAANDLKYKIWQEQKDLMAPWVDSGETNLNRLNYAMYGVLPEGVTADQMGVASGSLDPDWRFSMQDWYDSPEYQVYNQARDVSIRQGQDTINAQNAARGMFGSGTWANALASNISDQYAKYNPASLAAARNAAEAARTQQYNMMVGMANPTGAQQVANYAGQYGTNAAQLMQAAGNAQAQGIVSGNNALWNGVNSGLNQIGSAYGNYQGQQNFNALLQALQNRAGAGVGGYNWNQIDDMAGWNYGTDY